MKKSIILIILIIASAFVVVNLCFSHNKDKKALISYLEEHDYNSVELQKVDFREGDIYIEFSIINSDNLFNESIEIKKLIENYIDDKNLQNDKVDLYFSADGDSALHFSNHSDFDHLCKNEPRYRSDDNALGYALIYYPLCENKDISPIKECKNIKILHFIEPSNPNVISVIGQMKNLSYIRILLNDYHNKGNFDKNKLKKEIQSLHPDCIIEVN